MFSPALVQCIDDLTSGFKAWYTPLQHASRRHAGGRDTLLMRAASLRGTVGSAGGGGVAATPLGSAPYATRAPHTEGYESPAQAQAQGGENADAEGATRIPVPPLLLRLMQIQVN